jgi:hypothetical protein
MRTTLVALLALVTIGHAEEKVAEVPKVVRLEVMTWYHPLLEPGLAGITLLTTVVAQSQTTKTPGVLYWNVVRRAKQGASCQVKDLMFQNLASRNYRVLQLC